MFSSFQVIDIRGQDFGCLIEYGTELIYDANYIQDLLTLTNLPSRHEDCVLCVFHINFEALNNQIR